MHIKVQSLANNFELPFHFIVQTETRDPSAVHLVESFLLHALLAIKVYLKCHRVSQDLLRITVNAHRIEVYGCYEIYVVSFIHWIYGGRRRVRCASCVAPCVPPPSPSVQPCGVCTRKPRNWTLQTAATTHTHTIRHKDDEVPRQRRPPQSVIPRSSGSSFGFA